MQNSEFLTVALDAAREAEAVVRFYHDRQLEVMTKEDQSPVTVADVETEKKIKEIILGAFPEHGFYGEETGRSNNDSPFTWLIDPIDGTKSFIRDYPFFSTQIALMHENEIIVGVSNGMMFSELAWAAKGQGARLNDEVIHCSDIESLGEASLSTGNIKTLATNQAAWQGLATLSTQVNRTRGYGDFYHYHLLASGKIDIIVESDVNILDIAALSLIVTEAGGCFTDLQGQPPALDTTSVLTSAATWSYNAGRLLANTEVVLSAGGWP